MGLLEKTLRNATVTAKTPVRIVTLTGWDLKRIERSVPEAIEQVRATIESAGRRSELWPGGSSLRRDGIHRRADRRGDGGRG